MAERTDLIYLQYANICVLAHSAKVFHFSCLDNKSPIRALLYIYHKDIEVCHCNLSTVRSFNPDIQIHGLFGGTEQDYIYAAKRMKPILDSNTHFPTSYSTRWKWKNTDLMVRYWYQTFGRKAKHYDNLIVFQWDVIILDKISRCLPNQGDNEVLLSGLTALNELPEGWTWTNHGKNKEEWECFREYVRLVHGHKDNFLFCQGPIYSLPRSFLDRYSTDAITELCHDEIRLPFYSQVWGYEIVDTGVCHNWHDEETERYFNARSKPVMRKVILNELRKPDGRRIFHPVREKLRLPFDLHRRKKLSRLTLGNQNLSAISEFLRISCLILYSRLHGLQKLVHRYLFRSSRETFYTMQIPLKGDRILNWSQFIRQSITSLSCPDLYRNYLNDRLLRLTALKYDKDSSKKGLQERLEILQLLITSRRTFDTNKIHLIQAFCETTRALSQRAFNSASQYIKDHQYLSVHMSCEKYLPSAIHSRKTLSFPHPDIATIIIVGDPKLPRLRFRFDKVNRILYVPNGDRYEDLAEKTFLAYLFLYCMGADIPILKIDDDIFCRDQVKLIKTVFPLIKRIHYLGRVWHPWITGFARSWHCGRYKDNELGYRAYSGFADVTFAEGQAYGISKQALAILAISYVMYPDQIVFDKSYEDLTVGKCLSRLGIKPLHYELVTPGLLEQFDRVIHQGGGNTKR